MRSASSARSSPTAASSASIAVREAPRERADRVREHRRVRRAVADARRARTSVWASTWCSAEAGRVDHVAGEQRAERERVAVGLVARPARARAAARPRARRASRPGWRCTVHGALDRVAERVERARGELAHAAATRRARGRRRRPRAARAAWTRRRRARAGGRGSSRRPTAWSGPPSRAPPSAARERLRHVDHAPAAERDQAVAAARRRAGRRRARRPGPRRDVVHGARGHRDPRARPRCARSVVSSV